MRVSLGGVLCASTGFIAGFLIAAEADLLRSRYAAARTPLAIAVGLKQQPVSPSPRITLSAAAERKMTIPAKPCPSPQDALVIVVGGQSNAGNNVPTTHTAGPAVSVWYDGKCYPAADPLPGAKGTGGGSLWSVLGDSLSKRTARPIVLIVGAVGGTQFRDWNDPQSGLYAALHRRLESAAKAGFRPHLIVWHQGEADGRRTSKFGEFRRDMTALTDRLLSDAPDARLYLFQVSRCGGKPWPETVPAAIAVFRSVAAANPRIVLGMNTDELGREYRWDQCHFNSQGREAIVETVVPQLLPLLTRPAPVS